MNDAPAITLGALRRRAKEIPHPSMAAARTFVVECHPDIEEAVRALPNFVPVEKYRIEAPSSDEIGAVELFRFFRNDTVPAGTWSIA